MVFSVPSQVVGVDYSGRLIDTAQHLQREGTTVVMDCGKQISLQQFPGVHPERAVFKQVSSVELKVLCLIRLLKA